MKKRKIEKDNKKNKKNWLKLIGSFILLLGIIITTIDLLLPYIDKKNEDKSLEVFYQIEEELVENKEKTSTEGEKEEIKPKVKYNYIAALKIPKINLEKGLFAKNDKYNNVNFGLEILKESDSPDVINGNVIIAGHSGTANISYFKNLHRLEIGDKAIII